jgi:CheY-like chemotaxis protein
MISAPCTTPLTFSFNAGCLGLELVRHTQNQYSGYWQVVPTSDSPLLHTARPVSENLDNSPPPVDLSLSSDISPDHSPDRSPDHSPLYLVISNGQLVFASLQKLNWESLLTELLRYSPTLRNPELQAVWQIIREARAQGKPLSVCMSRLILVDRLLDYRGLNQIIRQSFLNQVDRFHNLSGQATFTTEAGVSAERPIVGLSLNELQVEMEKRTQAWQTLATCIPSCHHRPTLQSQPYDPVSVGNSKTQNILDLMAQELSVAQIASALGEDDLSIAQQIEPLARQDLIIWQTPLSETLLTPLVPAESITSEDEVPVDDAAGVVASEGIPTRAAPIEAAPVRAEPIEATSVEAVPTEAAPIGAASIVAIPMASPIIATHLVEPAPARLGFRAIAPIPPTAPLPEPQPAPTGPAIFIVDDSQMMLKQFASMVSAAGYCVTTVDDALRAVPAMLRNPPDAIFLDVNMPDMSGFQLIRAIRLQPPISHIPIIVLTAEKTFSNQQRARWSKCKFLPKPLSPKDLDSFRTNLANILKEVAPLSRAS